MGSMAELIKIGAMEVISKMQMCNIVFGTVTSIKPLVVETDQKLVLPHESLVVARDLTDYTLVISFDDESIKQRIMIYDKPEEEPVIKPTIPAPVIEKITDIQFGWTDYRAGENNGNEREGRQPVRHTVTVYNHLEIGERVIMIREEGGQRYFIIDREGKMIDGGERCDTRQWSFF